MKDPKKKLFGLILNGGLSRRMGSDKSKKMVSNKPLISLVVEKAKAQVDYLAIKSILLVSNLKYSWLMFLIENRL